MVFFQIKNVNDSYPTKVHSAAHTVAYYNSGQITRVVSTGVEEMQFARSAL